MKYLEELMELSSSSPYCAFTYLGSNLGDHIQTLALLQHFTAKMLMPRDHLIPQKDLNLIANGWLSSGNLPKREDYRSVKYVGVHIIPDLRTARTAEAMAVCGLIGSRDTSTHKFLVSSGVHSRVVGCASLTFPCYYGAREGIYCVDVNDGIKEGTHKIGYDPIYETHDCPLLSLDEANEDVIMDQYRKAYTLLEKYRKAELVITSRLHVTMPCLAFGTPVIYMGPISKTDDRVTILDRLGVKRLHWRVLKYHPSLALRKPKTIDISKIRESYINFLQDAIRV